MTAMTPSIDSHAHDHEHDHDHDKGFRHDLPRMIGRRGLLGLLTGAGALAATPGAALDLASCVINPTETAGPYPADGTNGLRRSSETINVLTQSGVLREDLRPSFAGMSPVAEGVEMTVEMHLMDAEDGCTPLAGHALYLWHCDGVGNYSLYDDTDRNYLRGLGVADAAGVVRFQTIFPGCYQSRWPHFHFEVFSAPEDAVTGRDSLLISQCGLPEAPCAEVYASHPAYSNGTGNLARNSYDRDMIFADGTEAQRAQQMMEVSGTPSEGYLGKVVIGI